MENNYFICYHIYIKTTLGGIALNIDDELDKLNTNQKQELEKWFAEQMDLIDNAIQELKYKSK